MSRPDAAALYRALHPRAALAWDAVLLGLTLAGTVGAWLWARRRKAGRAADRTAYRRWWGSPLAVGEVRASPRGVLKVGPDATPEQHRQRVEAYQARGREGARRHLAVKPGTRNTTIASRYGLTLEEVRRLRSEVGTPYRPRQFRPGDGRHSRPGGEAGEP